MTTKAAIKEARDVMSRAGVVSTVRTAHLRALVVAAERAEKLDEVLDTMAHERAKLDRHKW